MKLSCSKLGNKNYMYTLDSTKNNCGDQIRKQKLILELEAWQ